MQANGYKVLDRNFYCHGGEIDIIAKEDGYLVFIEVKYRSSTRMGYPEDAIAPYKIHRIIQSAKNYMYQKGYSIDTAVRFDVVVILGKEITIIKNAFEAG